jgi:hypothetical protein
MPVAVIGPVSARRGVGGRAGVGIGLRVGLRLDPDAQTDPFRHLTPQARVDNSGPRCIQTDPLWGLPLGGVDA